MIISTINSNNDMIVSTINSNNDVIISTINSNNNMIISTITINSNNDIIISTINSNNDMINSTINSNKDIIITINSNKDIINSNSIILYYLQAISKLQSQVKGHTSIPLYTVLGKVQLKARLFDEAVESFREAIKNIVSQCVAWESCQSFQIEPKLLLELNNDVLIMFPKWF